jgi:hypothetical protein
MGWRGSWFYMVDKAAPSQTFVLRPFENIAAEPLDSWKPVNDDSATPYVQLLTRQIAKLSKDGLRELIPSTVGYLGRSSPCSIVIA